MLVKTLKVVSQVESYKARKLGTEAKELGSEEKKEVH